MGRALDRPELAVTSEHLWWLNELHEGRGRDAPETLRRELEASGYVRTDSEGLSHLTDEGERLLRFRTAVVPPVETSSTEYKNLGRTRRRVGQRRTRSGARNR